MVESNDIPGQISKSKANQDFPLRGFSTVSRSLLHHLLQFHLAPEFQGALRRLQRGDELDLLLHRNGLLPGMDEIEEGLEEIGVEILQIGHESAPALFAVEVDLVAGPHLVA